MQSRHQNNKLPNELLVDIFKATDNTIMENLLPKVFGKDRLSSLKQKEFEKLWTNQVKNLLTSSSIIYLCVGKDFQKRWTKILEIGKQIREIEERERLVEEREKIVEKREKLVEESEKLVNAKTLELNERIVKLEASRRLLEEYERLAKKRKRWGSCQIVRENGGEILRRTRSHYDLSLTA
uniref:Uncharacterized protein n=1 Tax=Meloidogyne javanica TaxID=6303 RepID=A0A915NC24_MELJA